MLRGLIRENGYSINFNRAFEDKSFNETKLHSLEIPGNGYLYQQSSLMSVQEMMEYIREQFIQIKLKHPNAKNYLVAISLGGMIASAWLEKYPEDFNHVFIVNSSFAWACAPWKRLKINNFFNYFKVLLPTSNETKEKAIFDMIISHPDENQNLIKPWIEIRDLRPVSTLNALKQIWAGFKFTPPKSSPITPVKVVVGMGDKMVDPTCSIEIAKTWNVPLIQHPTGGHDLANDRAHWLIETLTNELNLK
jgi:alpha-beta hydrolase superfamily lysophospholipase